jgi:hypothetical protein
MQQHQARRYTLGTWLQPRLSLCHGPPAKCARLDGDLSTPDMLLNLAISPQYEEMYPMFSATIRRLLLLPVGSAAIERSFTTQNRILTSERSMLSHS